MNKFKNYLLIMFFTFFMGIQLVNATTFTIGDGKDSVNLSDTYSYCEKQIQDDNSEGWNYLNLDTSAGVMVYVKEKPGRTYSINLYCSNKNTNKQDSVTVKVTDKASKYAGYNENEEKESTFTLEVRRTLEQYTSCTINQNSSNNHPDNISVEDSDEGPVVSVAKVPEKGKENTYLTCTTPDGRKMGVTIIVDLAVSHIPKDTAQSDNEDVPSDCTSIIGKPDEKGSVAYILQKALNFIKFLGPILVVALTIMDLVKAVASNDKDALSKMLKTLTKRIVYALLLFVFPTLLDFVLQFISTHGTCGIK